MPEKDEEQQELKVIDRRRFTAEGDPLPGVEDPTPPPPAPDTSATPAQAKTGASLPHPAKPAPPASTPESEAYRKSTGSGPQMTFEHLLMSLSTSAMLQLGLVEDPEEGRLPADLTAAKQTIDLLGVLEQKTSGNLTPKEKQLLEQILAELRMAFVQISSGAPPEAPPGG